MLFERMTCSEALSEAYCLELSVLNERRDVKASVLLGQPVTVSFKLPSGEPRPFHGLVSRFVSTGDRIGGSESSRPLHRYRLRLQPWFWFLTRTADCRIFQNKTVQQIFESVVKAHGFSDYRFVLTRHYEQREYCVQYRETDFQFLSRLLEDAGIFYFFEHKDDKHVMVLADDAVAHTPAPSYPDAKYEQAAGGRGTLETIGSWWVENQVQPGSYATGDFNYLEPGSVDSLRRSSTHGRPDARSDFEVFEYPAAPASMSADEILTVAKTRLEEAQASYERYHGSASGCVWLQNGARFALTGHPDSDMRRDYVIARTQHTIVSNRYSSGDADQHGVSVALEAIDATVVFRPPRTTVKPMVRGAQTAIVVGPHGEEIYTDQYARVRVQFPWDRYGKSDENSSCWVRVAQAWAGKKWGAIHTPRIGQEVLISFLDGDPDRPIVTGRVYNGDALPPYELPANATQSGLKSNSSKGGNGSNELRFEDKKGEEEFYLHAQKDLTQVVENDETNQVKHDRKATVAGNDTLTVKQDQNVTVTQNLTLQADQKIVLKSGQSQLTMNMDGTIELKGVSITISGDQAVTAKVAQTQVALDPANLKLAAVMVDIKGNASTAVSGTMLDLKGSAMATLKGAITMIG